MHGPWRIGFSVFKVGDRVLSDTNGNSFGQKRIGKLLAVVWLLTAAFAMQVVSSAQGLSLRTSAELNAGNVAPPERGAMDPAVSAHAIRATPAADLRFTADRSDVKPLPGGPDVPLMPVRFLQHAHAFAVAAAHTSTALVRAGAVSHHSRVRAPPSAISA